MQTDLPRTGHLWVDVAVYIAIGLVTFVKGLAFLREKGYIAPAKTQVKEQTQMFRARSGPGGPERSNELWDYKIAELIEKKLEPLSKACDDQFEVLNEINKGINEILVLLKNSRPHR